MTKKLNKNFQKVTRANLRHLRTKNCPLISRINTNRKEILRSGVGFERYNL